MAWNGHQNTGTYKDAFQLKLMAIFTSYHRSWLGQTDDIRFWTIVKYYWIWYVQFGTEIRRKKMVRTVWCDFCQFSGSMPLHPPKPVLGWTYCVVLDFESVQEQFNGKLYISCSDSGKRWCQLKIEIGRRYPKSRRSSDCVRTLYTLFFFSFFLFSCRRAFIVPFPSSNAQVHTCLLFTFSMAEDI